MALLRKLLNLLNSKKRKEDEWAKNYSHIPPANPKNNIPLDPNAPWNT